jgi:hypothetical protein
VRVTLDSADLSGHPATFVRVTLDSADLSGHPATFVRVTLDSARYLARILRTRRETRTAVLYVLNNWRGARAGGPPGPRQGPGDGRRTGTA